MCRLKWFCIVLGIVLVIETIVPAPFGLVLEGQASVAALQAVKELIDDGSIKVNPVVTQAKHAPLGDPSAIIAASTARSLRVLGVWLSCGTFVLGAVWIAVGIRIPSENPRQTVTNSTDTESPPALG